MESHSDEAIMDTERGYLKIDVTRNRYPYCIVWTPIPMLTWMFPFIGHMGIAMSSGVIRDFAGPYFVSLLSSIYQVSGKTKVQDKTAEKLMRAAVAELVRKEDNMAFGNPTKYWQLNPSQVRNANHSWDVAVSSASEEYKHRMHNLCCDNCHSHVAMALNLMEYDNKSSWNMFKLTFFMLLRGKYVSFWGFIKTWLPFLLLAAGILLLVIFV